MPDSPVKTIANQLVASGRAGISIADREFAQGNYEDAQLALNIATQALDIGLSLTPGVGWAKDIYEAVSGKNLITGEKLETWERAAAVLGVATAGIGSKLAKAPKALAIIGDVIKASDKGEEAIQALATAEKIFETSNDAIKAIGPEKFADILKMPKGSRPLPETYLPKEYIEKHLAKFDEGASRFMHKSRYEQHGPAQIDGTSFVIPKNEAESILKRAGGNKKLIEESLGLTPGILDSDQLVRIDIANPKQFNVRIPSGNEVGANAKWLPGGKLLDGNSEAIIDLGNAPKGSWTVENINF